MSQAFKRQCSTSIYLFVYAAIFVLVLSGCVGVVTFSPAKCTDQPFPWSSKEEFVKNWGTPDKVEIKSVHEEVWTYSKHRWCGVLPCWVVCFPFVLPVCDGSDRVSFKNDQPIRLDTQPTSGTGFLLILIDLEGGVVSDDPCPVYRPFRPR